MSFTVADILGLQQSAASKCPFKLTRHAERQAALKGYTLDAVFEAAANPSQVYRSNRHPNQARHVRDHIVAVIDLGRSKIVTVYDDRVVTPYRDDQQMAEAA